MEVVVVVEVLPITITITLITIMVFIMMQRWVELWGVELLGVQVVGEPLMAAVEVEAEAQLEEELVHVD
jgi:hypothetical protein